MNERSSDYSVDMNVLDCSGSGNRRVGCPYVCSNELIDSIEKCEFLSI